MLQRVFSRPGPDVPNGPWAVRRFGGRFDAKLAESTVRAGICVIPPFFSLKSWSPATTCTATLFSSFNNSPLLLLLSLNPPS